MHSPYHYGLDEENQWLGIKSVLAACSTYDKLLEGPREVLIQTLG